MSRLIEPSDRLNRLKDVWAAGKPTFGAIVTVPSIQVVQILARAGFDWLLIDMEHGAIDLPGAHAMITATAATPAVPFARVGGPSRGSPRRSWIWVSWASATR